MAVLELAPWMTGHGPSLIFADGSRTVNTTGRGETIVVITRDQRRWGWSLVEKAALVRRTYEPGMSVSLVARNEGVSASLLFQWRKLERQGALTAVHAGEAVVPASELAAARAEIAKLQRVLGKKTLENEILKEAVEYATEKKWSARSPLLPGDGE
jgi:transposase-like protein